jgi:acetyl esterase/lipase
MTSLFTPLALLLSTTILLGCATMGHHHTYKVEKDLVYKTIDGIELKGDIYQPEDGGLKPAVLVVHGGGWKARSGDMVSICEDLARAGFVAFNITYRLAPKTHFPKAVEDVRDALAWLKSNSAKYEVDPQQISGWGYSAGANLILLAGLDPAQKMQAIVAGGTPADLPAWPDSSMVFGFIGSTFKEKPELWKEASPIYHVQAGSPPVFLYHGEWDHIVEIAQMDKMQAALVEKNVPVETLRLHLMGHLAVYFFSQKAVDQGIRFLEKRAAKPAAVIGTASAQ